MDNIKAGSSQGANAWIGLYRTGSNSTNFANFDATPVDFKKFNTAQPDNYQNNEFCTEMYIRQSGDPDGVWNDVNCDLIKPSAVCKKLVDNL